MGVERGAPSFGPGFVAAEQAPGPVTPRSVDRRERGLQEGEPQPQKNTPITGCALCVPTLAVSTPGFRSLVEIVPASWRGGRPTADAPDNVLHLPNSVCRSLTHRGVA